MSIKVNKLGGELEEEKQLNKSLRENQEEWQVGPSSNKSLILYLIAFNICSPTNFPPSSDYCASSDSSEAGWGWGGSAPEDQRSRDPWIARTGFQLSRVKIICVLSHNSYKGQGPDVLYGSAISSQGVASEGWDTRGKVDIIFHHICQQYLMLFFILLFSTINI